MGAHDQPSRPLPTAAVNSLRGDSPRRAWSAAAWIGERRNGLSARKEEGTRVTRHVHNERSDETEIPREGSASQCFSESPPVFRLPRFRMVSAVTSQA